MRNYLHKTFTLIIALFIGFSSNGQINIESDDSNIQYTGRIDFSDPKNPSFMFPGISIKAKFNGAKLGFEMTNSTGNYSTSNLYTVIIDGEVDTIMTTKTGTHFYMVSTTLGDCAHTVELYKRTEGVVGESSFGGFYVEGGLQPLNPKSSRKIEFIGDSRTAGYGNVIDVATSGEIPAGFRPEEEDNYNTWGAITSRRLDAQFHCIGISGIGLSRNNNLDTNTTMPKQFLEINQKSNEYKWSPSNYIPNVLVIHLGTNDFYYESLEDTLKRVMLDSAAYVHSYVRFIKAIRTHYPEDSTKIIMCYGNSKSDWWPTDKRNPETPLMTLTRWERNVNSAVSILNSEGFNELYAYKLPSTLPGHYGADWHPPIVGHIDMADKITPYIQNLMNWSNGPADCSGVLDGFATLDVCNKCSGGNTSLDANSCCNQTGIKEAGNNNLIGIYPNPFTGSINIEGFIPNSIYSIYDLNGKKIMDFSKPSIDLSSLKAGYYLLKHRGTGVHNKIIKQ